MACVTLHQKGKKFIIMIDFVRFHEIKSVTNCDRLKMTKQMLFLPTLPEKCVPGIRSLYAHQLIAF